MDAQMMKSKLGMFIHWGIYSDFGRHEQVFAQNRMDRAEYEAAATRFNPTEYDPEDWVLLAKSAGMKYINGANTVSYFGAILFSVKGE